MPAGLTFLSGSVTLRSHVELHLERGAVLQASGRWEDITVRPVTSALSGGVVRPDTPPNGVFLWAQGATDAADQAARRARTASEWSRRPEERQDTQGLFWMAHPQVVPRLNRMASGSEQANAYDRLLERLRAQGWTFPVRRAASLGCGFGALERGLLQLGVAERIDGYDLAPAAIALQVLPPTR